MSWTIAQTDQILRWAEHGHLSEAQLQQAEQLAPLKPDRHAWFDMGERFCAYAGALLLAASVIFFFAYNWAELHRFAKIGTALGALASCVVVALFCRPYDTAWRAALFCAAACTGALLALIGQIYQTGADVWALFAAWAALMLPFAALSRSSATWLLWQAVANAAVIRALSQHVWFSVFGVLSTAGGMLAVAGLNLACLIVLERYATALLARPNRHPHRAAALLAVAALAIGACLGWWESSFAILVPVFAAVATAMAMYYRYRRLDTAMLAIVGTATIAVSSAALMRLLSDGDNFLILNLLALFIILSSGGLAVWLRRLHRGEHIQSSSPEASE